MESNKLQALALSEEQQKIVHYNNGEGPLLVVAAAGSGKTRILTERVRYLLTEKPGRFSVLCLTFTNKAAEEMQVRLENVPNVRERAFIGTIHGFALQVLTARRLLLGMDEMPHLLDRDTDRKKVIEQVLLVTPSLFGDFDKKEPKEQYQLIEKSLHWISEQKRNLIEIDEEAPLPTGWTEARKRLFLDYNQLLRDQSLIDYDDILYFTYKILMQFPAVARIYQRQFQFVLVDEAQDLNFAQYNLIKAICGDAHKNILMVGDPNQAIHGYAGAEKKFMELLFGQDYQAERVELTKNFRSSKAVLQLANHLIPNSSKPEDAFFEGIAKRFSHENDEREAEWVISQIKRLVTGDVEPDLAQKNELELPLSLDQIAVLARNKFVFRPIETLLKNDSFFEGQYFFKKASEALDMETELMRIFDLGTRILCNPSDELHFKQILQQLSIEEFGFPRKGTGIEKLATIAGSLGPKKQFFYGELLKSWSLLVQIDSSKSKMPAALTIIGEFVNANIQEDVEKSRILIEISDYQDAWEKFLRSSSTHGSLLAGFRQFVAMGTTDSRKNNGLTLATVHTSKGLQFDVVFLIGMNNGDFPDYRAVTPEQLNEEKNAAYVAITRTKRWLFVSYPISKMMPWGSYKQQNPSRFLNGWE